MLKITMVLGHFFFLKSELKTKTANTLPPCLCSVSDVSHVHTQR